MHLGQIWPLPVLAEGVGANWKRAPSVVEQLVGGASAAWPLNVYGLPVAVSYSPSMALDGKSIPFSGSCRAWIYNHGRSLGA